MDYGLSYQEYRIKNSPVRMYETFDYKLADRLIGLKKYLYYVESKPHWRTGIARKCYFFESCRELYIDVGIIKKELYGTV